MGLFEKLVNRANDIKVLFLELDKLGEELRHSIEDNAQLIFALQDKVKALETKYAISAETIPDAPVEQTSIATKTQEVEAPETATTN